MKNRKNGWHLYKIGENYDPQDFFRDVFNTLIDENSLEVERKPEGYWWKLINHTSRVVIKARSGQMLKISLADDK